MNEVEKRKLLAPERQTLIFFPASAPRPRTPDLVHLGGPSSDSSAIAGTVFCEGHSPSSRRGLDGVKRSGAGRLRLRRRGVSQTGTPQAAEAKDGRHIVSLDTGAVAKTSPVSRSISADRGRKLYPSTDSR